VIGVLRLEEPAHLVDLLVLAVDRAGFRGPERRGRHGPTLSANPEEAASAANHGGGR
jgi:hypothetical protein